MFGAIMTMVSWDFMDKWMCPLCWRKYNSLQLLHVVVLILFVQPVSLAFLLCLTPNSKCNIHLGRQRRHPEDQASHGGHFEEHKDCQHQWWRIIFSGSGSEGQWSATLRLILFLPIEDKTTEIYHWSSAPITSDQAFPALLEFEVELTPKVVRVSCGALHSLLLDEEGGWYNSCISHF